MTSFKTEITFIANSPEEAQKIKALLQTIANQDTKELARVSDKVVKNPKIINTAFKFL